MNKWFSNSNKRILEKHSIADNFPWGAIQQIHEIGDYHIVEYIDDYNKDKIMFHPYVNRDDTNRSIDSLDVALLVAMEYKYDGPNSQFARFAIKMLGMEENE